MGDKIIIDDWLKYFFDISEEKLPRIFQYAKLYPEKKFCLNTTNKTVDHIKFSEYVYFLMQSKN